jgi:N-acetylneuraminic acid mutarotase
MAAASLGGNVYFFGGVGAAGTESILDVSADLWCFDTAALAWRPIERSGPAWPAPRRCVGWSAHHGQLLLWGGSGITVQTDGRCTHNFLNDEWQFDPSTEAWTLVSPTDDHRLSPIDKGNTSPFPRYTPVFQTVGDELFLFGGYTEDRLGKRKLNDAWVRSGRQWRQVPFGAKPGYTVGADWPGLRYGSMAAADEENVYVCGGFSDDGDHIDLWRFDMASRQWRLLAPDDDSETAPKARYCGAFARYGRKLFLFGGRSRMFPKLNFNDLWMFDLDANTWSMLSDNRFPHR